MSSPQRNYGFLITKELIFGFQILDLKDHFSASLIIESVPVARVSQHMLFTHDLLVKKV